MNAGRLGADSMIPTLARRGFRRVDFEGIAPVEPIRTTTSILYRDGSVRGL